MRILPRPISDGPRALRNPEYVGKLGFYVAWVDDNLRAHDRHAPTIGILLCASRNDNVVRYSLAGTTAPLAVATYTDDELTAALGATISEASHTHPLSNAGESGGR